MFEGRSVDYTDENLRYAIQQISEFEADFGGTEIFRPLSEIFSQAKPADCDVSHIYLLTDGAIWDVQKCVNLVASKCSMQ